MLTFVADNAAAMSATYGNVTRPSVGAIQRQLLQLEPGRRPFFGEPALDLFDFLRSDENGRGTINILLADKLMTSPRLYATFLLWLLSELFERLPEVGDPPKPKLVFFFDEAHLLFEDAPRALVDKIEQVVRLIRSKGVGVFFITQDPSDIPEDVAGQLGNRFQHALRAATAKDDRSIKAAAETFRPNPGLDVAAAITELRTGEALVQLLDASGAPRPVERTLMRPPGSRVGPLAAEGGARSRRLAGRGQIRPDGRPRERARETEGAGGGGGRGRRGAGGAGAGGEGRRQSGARGRAGRARAAAQPVAAGSDGAPGRAVDPAPGGEPDRRRHRPRPARRLFGGRR